MVDEADHLVLVYLGRIDGKVDALAAEMREVKDRISAVEISLASVRRDLSHLAETDARLQVSMDRMRDDINRIQRRLDLTEPAA